MSFNNNEKLYHIDVLFAQHVDERKTFQILFEMTYCINN